MREGALRGDREYRARGAKEGLGREMRRKGSSHRFFHSSSGRAQALEAEQAQGTVASASVTAVFATATASATQLALRSVCESSEPHK